MTTGEFEEATRPIIFFSSTAGFDCPDNFTVDCIHQDVASPGTLFAIGYIANYAMASLNGKFLLNNCLNNDG